MPSRAGRIVDVAVASVLFALTLPVAAAAALAIVIVDPGPVLFRQRRIGRGQRPFTLLKLRTMRLDASALLERHFTERPEDRHEWDAFARLRNDPRIIPLVGRMLRRFSIDEVPQLVNVIRGDMALVGPRPLEPRVAQAIEPAVMAERSAVLPGLTGLWQVSGRGDVAISDMVAFDREYLRTRSVRRDIAILLRTPAAVLFGRGAY